MLGRGWCISLASYPLILSFSPWEKGRLNRKRCNRRPLSQWGEGQGEGSDASDFLPPRPTSVTMRG